MRVAVVVPVYGNAASLPELAARLERALADHDGRVRLVVDASPDDSAAVAAALAGPRLAVTVLAVNVGQHGALRHGLAQEAGADAWVVLDADLQDPPEAVPALLSRLFQSDVDAVFAGRRGGYERAGRLVTGGLHRRLVSALTGLPRDAGAFFAMGPAARAAVLAGGPSVVASVGAARLATASVPVVRGARAQGRSAWTSRARAAQSARTLGWLVARRVRSAPSAGRAGRCCGP